MADRHAERARNDLRVSLPSSGCAPTFGVEEEYFLLDPATATLMPVAEPVLERARRRATETAGRTGWSLNHELLQHQVEIATPVCISAAELEADLRWMRSYLAVAAWREGAVLAPIGTPPIDTVVDAKLITVDHRYRKLQKRMPELVREELVCGMHVHVGVPSRAVGVTVLNRLRPWMHVLLALAANSPLWGGGDSGFASWRTLQMQRWPLHGVPPPFATVIDYESHVAGLARQRVITDRGQLYWCSRLSERYPTVEVRVPDVQLTVAESSMIATLIRALVARAMRDMADGQPEPVISQETVEHACWLAARHGTSEDLLDLTGQRDGTTCRPAAWMLDQLVDLVGGGALQEDMEYVLPRLDRAVVDGGAARQRAAMSDRGTAGLIDLLQQPRVPA